MIYGIKETIYPAAVVYSAMYHKIPRKNNLSAAKAYVHWHLP